MPGSKDDATTSKRRSRILAATAAALLVSLIGGLLVLLFGGKAGQPATALKPIVPSLRFTQGATPAAPTEEAGPDLSMFGLGETSGGTETTASAAGLPSGTAGLIPGGGAPAPGLPSLPAMQLPAAPQLPELPPAPDWDALTAPLAAAYANAQAANVAGSIAGPVAGLAGAGVNSAAVIVGDLILYSALGNNGQNVLNQLQTSLAATPGLAAAAASLGAGTPQLAPPDLTGLTAAFAAAAAAPPLGVPALPALPALPPMPDLPPLPPLPTPDQLAAGLALPALGAIGLPALPVLPPFQFPVFEAPRPPDLTPLLLLPLLGLLPSPTRMLGLPF